MENPLVEGDCPSQGENSGELMWGGYPEGEKLLGKKLSCLSLNRALYTPILKAVQDFSCA